MPKIKNTQLLEHNVTVSGYATLTGKSTFTIYNLIKSGEVASKLINGTNFIPFPGGDRVIKKMKKTTFIQLDEDPKLEKRFSFGRNDDRLYKFLTELHDSLDKTESSIQLVYWELKKDSIDIHSIYVVGKSVQQTNNLSAGYFGVIRDSLDKTFTSFGIKHHKEEITGGDKRGKHGGYIITANK